MTTEERASLKRHRVCVAECLAIADAAGVHRHTPQESMLQLRDERDAALARVKELEAIASEHTR